MDCLLLFQGLAVMHRTGTPFLNLEHPGEKKPSALVLRKVISWEPGLTLTHHPLRPTTSCMSRPTTYSKICILSGFTGRVSCDDRAAAPQCICHMMAPFIILIFDPGTFSPGFFDSKLLFISPSSFYVRNLDNIVRCFFFILQVSFELVLAAANAATPIVA